MDISISGRQNAFIRADAFEVLFGGAAGGGKSYGQLIDALLYALKYPGSKQLILRRTFPELDKSLIRVSLELYPREVYTYNSSTHTGKFKNGSIIDYGYCDAANDVYKYQSAEYDIIRFDELTHFTEQMYVYLISRVRGANNFPKSVRSSTNPGGVGHSWVKARFVDIGAPNITHECAGGTRIFLPSKVQDNTFLMAADPGYIGRLQNLSERDQRALLYGDWDIFDGQYFTEWDRALHVSAPFAIPAHWRRYFTMDYGLDMLAGYWIAVDEAGAAYVYRELYKSGLIISDAARAICEMDDDDVYAYYAPPDLWH
ncbi:MAG: phage terminase large subunit, partial [Clostridia bacterium]